MNLNQFCKSKQCEHRVEREHPVGLCTYCNLCGFSFNISRFPSICEHVEEIRALIKHEEDKRKVWDRLKKVEKKVNDENIL